MHINYSVKETGRPLFLCGSCADPEGGGRESPPLKNHKNIGFLSNTGQYPLKSENHKAFKPVLNVGPS